MTMHDTNMLIDPTLDIAAAINPRPAEIPEKFWDSSTGTLRSDALLKSYLALERKLGSLKQQPPTPRPETPETPEIPENYCIDCSHGLFEADDDLNEKLRNAGFTPAQAQLFYDIAAERMPAILRQLAAEMDAERQLEKLVAAFGGEQKWQDVARELYAYGRKNLPNDVLSTLATSYEGVMALYKMMQENSNRNPLETLNTSPSTPNDETSLKAMMRDPRYWRDRNPAFIANVTEGFRRLYPQN